MNGSFSIRAILADIPGRSQYPVTLQVSAGKIVSVLREIPVPGEVLPFLLPGFVDSHVHIESSLLAPSEFARLAVLHGTVATISDPHEIANVCGMDGVEFMIRNGQSVPFKFYFGAPSCVPATVFETAGAELDSAAVEQLLDRPEIRYLSEMMNFPGVLQGDPEVLKKISAARQRGKPVDGHAPGLRGEQAALYARPVKLPAEAGGGPVISTDHECFTAEEALDKLKTGMKILIREGSAAKNFEVLIGLLNDWPSQIMFCSDDKHPDSLLEGHINQLCARAVKKGADLYKVLQAACMNPVQHYGLELGQLGPGDPADFILVKDLQDFVVLKTFIGGELVAEENKSYIKRQAIEPVNNFCCTPKQAKDFELKGMSSREKITANWLVTEGDKQLAIPVIQAIDGQLITNRISARVGIHEEILQPDRPGDILKIAVINRYRDAPAATAFINGFGLKKGALASSVAHDSHNIVAVGVDDESLCRAVNLVIAEKGGLSAVCGQHEMILPLPLAGLMSDQDAFEIAAAYTAIDRMTKEEMGSVLRSPFMTLSFMALLVIPHLKLSDKGLFDGDRFCFI